MNSMGITGAPIWGFSALDLDLGVGSGVHTGQNRPSRAAAAARRPRRGTR